MLNHESSMNRIRSLLNRQRLMTSMLALGLVLGALAIPPAEADIGTIDDSKTCAYGCVGWDAGRGCYNCQFCCSWSDGSWACNGAATSMCN